MPKISVCIPNYNYAEYLVTSIASVLAQDESDFELLILDDCSSDESEKVVRGFGDPRISFERNLQRLGLVENWNACTERARGDFVLILHADDYLLPGSLRAEREVFEQNPGVGLVFTAVQLIDADGHSRSLLQPFAGDFVAASSEFVPQLLVENFIRTPTVMVRRACYNELGGYDTELRYSVDWEMWLRIAAAYEVAYLAQPYAAYREHTLNATRDFQRDAGDLREEAQALDIFFRAHPEFAVQKPAAYEALGTRATEQVKTSLVDGDAERAIAYVRVAAQAREEAHGTAFPTSDAAMEILAQSAVGIVTLHKELQRWALELQAELERRDAANQNPGGLLRGLGLRRSAPPKDNLAL